MNRRSILQSLAGLLGAKTLPAAKVKIPASLQVAKAAAAANPLFNATCYVAVTGKDGKMALYSYIPKPDCRVKLNRRIS
jgi:hypothetical protein